MPSFKDLEGICGYSRRSKIAIPPPYHSKGSAAKPPYKFSSNYKNNPLCVAHTPTQISAGKQKTLVNIQGPEFTLKLSVTWAVPIWNRSNNNNNNNK